MSALAKQHDRFSETDVDQEIVVMRLDSGEFFSLAGTAAAAWRLIDGTRDRSALVKALAEQFEGDEAEIAADVDDLIAELQGHGLIGAG